MAVAPIEEDSLLLKVQEIDAQFREPARQIHEPPQNSPLGFEHRIALISFATLACDAAPDGWLVILACFSIAFRIASIFSCEIINQDGSTATSFRSRGSYDPSLRLRLQYWLLGQTQH